MICEQIKYKFEPYVVSSTWVNVRVSLGEYILLHASGQEGDERSTPQLNSIALTFGARRTVPLLHLECIVA